MEIKEKHTQKPQQEKGKKEDNYISKKEELFNKKMALKGKAKV